jgi:cysteine desulfurase / selenocysteine lyase
LAIYWALMAFDIDAIRRQFPFLKGDNDIAYFDNAATTQKPSAVLDAMQSAYSEGYGNIHRGMHALAEKTTVAYEAARVQVATFIGARAAREVIFTRSATESINLVARSLTPELLGKKKTITLSLLEHHSNIVPWMQRSSSLGNPIAWIGIDADGPIDLKAFEHILKEDEIGLVAITGLSNALGVAPPLNTIIAHAHAAGALVLIDAAQLIAHQSIDVVRDDIDFLTFSGHKIYGPTGVGVLYGKEKLLEQMDPFLGGGDMVSSVTMKGFVPAELPRKFEAGTPPIVDAIGLGAALRWMQDVGTDTIHRHTQDVLRYTEKKLASVDGLSILAPTIGKERLGSISFTLKGVHPHDLTEILGREGICLRAGHHCCMPLHRHLGIPASTRLSVAAYNTEEEIDRCIKAMGEAKKILRP